MKQSLPISLVSLHIAAGLPTTANAERHLESIMTRARRVVTDKTIYSVLLRAEAGLSLDDLVIERRIMHNAH